MRFSFLTTILILFHFSKVDSQCMSYPVSLEERVLNSHSIVLAFPVDAWCYMDSTTGIIYTMNKMEVIAYLKNPSSHIYTYLITKGGILGDKAVSVYPALQIDSYNEYILFLEPDEQSIHDKVFRENNPHITQHSPYTDSQGALVKQFGLYRDAYSEPPSDESKIFERIKSITGGKIYTPDGVEFNPRPFQNDPSGSRSVQITSFSPNPTPAGTVNSVNFLTITGNNFGATQGTVWYRNADNGGTSWINSGVTSDNVSWSNTQVVNKVAQGAGTGLIRVQTSGGTNYDSGTSLTVPYSHLCVNSSFYLWPVTTRNKVLLVNKNNQGGYSFKYSTVFNDNQSRVESFERAMETWQCNTLFNIINDGTTSINTNAADGTNAVFWASLGGGTLGICYSYYSGQGNSNCQQGNTVWYLNEIDIGFNNTTTWNYGPGNAPSGQFDFESVALHELGHAHGLGHVINTSSVMHFSISSGQNKRTLSAGEQDGGNAKMAYSVLPLCLTPSGVFGPMTEFSCALPVELISFEANRNNKQSVRLNWSIGHSHANQGFDIQRSNDGIIFQNIGFVQAGNDSKKQFEYIDHEAGNKSLYYKLVQIDWDGSARNIGVRYVSADFSGQYKIYSSGSNMVRAESFNDAADIATLNLYSIQGVLLSSSKIYPNSTIDIEIPLLSPIILYEIISDNQIERGKVFIQQ
jgi:hypothetical protein